MFAEASSKVDDRHTAENIVAHFQVTRLFVDVNLIFIRLIILRSCETIYLSK